MRGLTRAGKGGCWGLQARLAASAGKATRPGQKSYGLLGALVELIAILQPMRD
jgi:hypothetical protein